MLTPTQQSALVSVTVISFRHSPCSRYC